MTDELRLKRSTTPWIIMAISLLVVAFVEPTHHAVNRHREAAAAATATKSADGATERTATVPPDQEQGFLGIFFYTVEHLAAVVFVAMIVRVVLEEAAERHAVATMTTVVREKLDEAFESVDQKVANFEAQVSKVEAELHSMEVLTGGNLYSKRLQPGDKEEIARVFLNPVFFRPSFKLDLTLTPRGQDIVDLCIRTDGLLENISTESQPYSVSALLDNVLFNSGTASFSRSAKFDRFEYGPNTAKGRERGALQPFDLSRYKVEELKEARHLTEVGTDLAFSYTPGDKIPPGETYFIKMEGTQQMRESDLLLWYMFTATQDLELNVHLEGGLTVENFTVIARPIHHKEHIPFEPKYNEDGTRMTWVVKGVLLPYQGVTVWWSRKPPATVISEHD
jgi:hypothetical protein